MKLEGIEDVVYPVVVIGGGPSGVACVRHLKMKGIKSLLIEKKDMLQTWKHERWDSFYLVTPNWMTNLPGLEDEFPYDNEFMSREEIYMWLNRFLDSVDPDYIDHTAVYRLYGKAGAYTLETSAGRVRCERVIVATGMFNKPYTPVMSLLLPSSVNQIHSSEYFRPDQLAPGNVIVVGSGRSGVQIALEIRKETNRDVYLSVGSLTPIPVIYRNVNGVYWLNRLSGYKRGKEILTYGVPDLHSDNIRNKISQNLFTCEKAGVVMVGRLVGVESGKVKFADNLCEVLEAGANYLRDMEKLIDDEIARSGLVLDDRHIDFNLRALDCHALNPVLSIDVDRENIGNIIWCTGFRPDYGWIDLEIFGSDGMPILPDGYSTHEEVYFCGMGLQPDKTMKSSFGVGLYAFDESAMRAVDALVRRMKFGTE